jgi:hypothetical protein
VLRAYKYLFYKLCAFERAWGDPVPAVTGFCFLLFLQLLNLGSLFILIDRFHRITWPIHSSFANALVFNALLALPQYFFLLHGRRYRRVVGEFAHENERNSVIGGLLVGVYVVFSFVFLILVAEIPSRHV